MIKDRAQGSHHGTNIRYRASILEELCFNRNMVALLTEVSRERAGHRHANRIGRSQELTVAVERRAGPVEKELNLERFRMSSR